MPATPIYLLSLQLNTCPKADFTSVTEAKTCLQDHKLTILHRFKVVGEDNLLLVISADDGNCVDSFVSKCQKSTKMVVDYCSPLMAYDTFSEFLKVEKPEGERVQLANGPFFWLQFNIDYPGKSIEELKDIWKQEASTALQFKLKAALDLFKVVGERKVHVFLQAPVEMVDELSFTLPLVCGLGDGVRIVSKAVTRF